MKIFFAGDVYIKEAGNRNIFSKPLVDYIASHDIACCNFEGPIVDECKDPICKIGPSIKNDKGVAPLLKNSGFNLVTLANNHIMDYGAEGLKSTIEALNELGIKHIGAGLNKEEIINEFSFEDESISIGLLSVAENGFGCAMPDDNLGYLWFDSTNFLSKIRECKAKYDYLAVISHVGSEGFEFPLPELREKYQKWIDMGVDLVVAHHPHVAQGFEEYNGKRIYYSLGNFVFDKGESNKPQKTLNLSINITNGRIDYNHVITSFDQEVELIEDDQYQEHITHISDILKCENYNEYIKRVNSYCLESFNKYYASYYGKTRVLTSIYNKIFKKKSLYNKWLYHNLVIETHYWVCRRALILSDNKKEI